MTDHGKSEREAELQRLRREIARVRGVIAEEAAQGPVPEARKNELHGEFLSLTERYYDLLAINTEINRPREKGPRFSERGPYVCLANTFARLYVCNV
jgi:hypothetical protein